ncbi:aspartate--tRNA ligase dps1 [Coelomomyces lativittatus]|nr:aspartate--tRNA ligase dps1 [Coelomomyces lativittatus]
MENVQLDADGKPLSEKALKKLKKEQEKQKRKEEVAARLAQEKALRDAQNPDYSKDVYGLLPVNMSQKRENKVYTAIEEMHLGLVGETLRLRARVQASRAASNKLCFFILRQQFHTVQAVVSFDEVAISKQMVKFASGISDESIVFVEALVVQPDEIVKSCTVQDVELQIKKLFVESFVKEVLPFTLENASRPEKEFLRTDAQFSKVHLDTRLNHRTLDLRTITNQAIFRIQSGICQLFREFLYQEKFIEIHSPKLLGTASESGASVFEVTYFKTKAYLAQSPQFYKQMMICADYERVFEIGPVFRAENANTHRHMTEFTGIDLEMSFLEHYSEVLDVLDRLFVFLFTELERRYAKELEIVHRQYPFPKFEFLKKTLRLTYPEAVAMLREAHVDMADDEDLSTEKERTLGQLVKQKYHTDFYMLTHFPLVVRPFYTMPDPHHPMYSNSYDFFMRGEEILSGAQRVHDPELLEQRIKEHHIDPVSIQPYLDAFKHGVPPHAGGGIGLERILMLYLNLFNIRRATLFPRDPQRLHP